MVDLFDEHFLCELVDHDVGLGHQLQVESLGVPWVQLAQLDDLGRLDPLFVQQVVRHLQVKQLLLVLNFTRFHFIHQLVHQRNSLLYLCFSAEMLA